MKEAYSTADPGTQTRAVPETGKIHRTYSLFNIFIKKTKDPYSDAYNLGRPDAVPKEAPSHRTYTLFNIFIEKIKRDIKVPA